MTYSTTGRHRAPRVRSLLGRLDAWTLWAFNAPQELTSRRTPRIDA